MDTIEKRARELLAAQYVNEGRMLSAKETMDGHDLQAHAEYLVLRAISAALTPPKGYVQVPVDLSTLQRYDLGTIHFYGDEKEDIVECTWGSYVQLSDVQALLTARPEVQP